LTILRGKRFGDTTSSAIALLIPPKESRTASTRSNSYLPPIKGCWGLMAALFALGVMSLTWMIAVAGLIAVEKLLPWRALANRLVAVTLVALALGVSFAPRHVPGLTLPGPATAAKSIPGDVRQPAN
jgi:hypothetical protein